MFGTDPTQAIGTTRSLTPYELAQLQLEPQRMLQAQNLAQRQEAARQFDADLALQQQQQQALYGGVGPTGLEVQRQFMVQILVILAVQVLVL